MELVSNAQSWAKEASDLSNIGKTLGLNLFIRTIQIQCLQYQESDTPKEFKFSCSIIPSKDVRNLCLNMICGHVTTQGHVTNSELEVYTLNKSDLLYMTKSGIYVQFGSVHESSTTRDIRRNDLIMTSNQLITSLTTKFFRKKHNLVNHL